MQLFEALVLMAGINLTDGRPLAGEVESVVTDTRSWSDKVKFKDGSYIVVNWFSCSYEPGTSNKVFASVKRSRLRYAEAVRNDVIPTEEAFRELCFKIAEIY